MDRVIGPFYGHTNLDGMTTTMSTPTLTATDVKQHLELLHEERRLAVSIGLAADGAYMADLEDEIAACTAAYVGAAVTEIASMRAALSGPLQG
jgi:hypothetical protein